MKHLLIILLLFTGCQQKTKVTAVDYLEVQSALAKDNFVTNFSEKSIHQRGGPGINLIWLAKPNVHFFVIDSNDVESERRCKRELLESFARHSIELDNVQADSIIADLRRLISFMKKYSISHESYVGTSSKRMSYFIDFGLSQHEYLRYFHNEEVQNIIYPENVIEAKWIDSSWVYLKEKSVKDTVSVRY